MFRQVNEVSGSLKSYRIDVETDLGGRGAVFSMPSDKGFFEFYGDNNCKMQFAVKKNKKIKQISF
jgi:hypothetical protein